MENIDKLPADSIRQLFSGFAEKCTSSFAICTYAHCTHLLRRCVSHSLILCRYFSPRRREGHERTEEAAGGASVDDQQRDGPPAAGDRHPSCMPTLSAFASALMTVTYVCRNRPSNIAAGRSKFSQGCTEREDKAVPRSYRSPSAFSGPRAGRTVASSSDRLPEKVLAKVTTVEILLQKENTEFFGIKLLVDGFTLCPRLCFFFGRSFRTQSSGIFRSTVVPATDRIVYAHSRSAAGSYSAHPLFPQFSRGINSIAAGLPPIPQSCIQL